MKNFNTANLLIFLSWSEHAKAECQEIDQNDNKIQSLTDCNNELEQMDTEEPLKIKIEQLSLESDIYNINNTMFNPNSEELKGLESIMCNSPTQATTMTEQIIKEEESINCLLCTNLITFPNLYEYQRHLGLIHYRQQITDTYLPPGNTKSPFSCVVCLNESGNKISFGYETFLIIHLATRHNCCIEFAETNVDMLLGTIHKLRNYNFAQI